MLAVFELVHSLLANKRQIVHHDWLAVINIMAPEWMDVSCVDYTNYTSPFHLCNIHKCIQTDFGRLRFHLRHLNKSLLQQCHRLPSLPYLTVVQQNVVVCDTNVGQQMLPNICSSCVRSLIIQLQHASLIHAEQSDNLNLKPAVVVNCAVSCQLALT